MFTGISFEERFYCFKGVWSYYCLIMANGQSQGGALPSSQGGLTMYVDADTGFELDPWTIVAFSTGIGIVTTLMQSTRFTGLFF